MDIFGDFFSSFNNEEKEAEIRQAAAQSAKTIWVLYKDLLNEGFNESQALEIVIRTIASAMK